MKTNAKHFIVLSLGQLTKSNVKPSISAFAKLLSGNDWIMSPILYPFAFCYVSAVYGFDCIIKGNIERYKTGHLTTDGFRKYLKSFIWTGGDSQIDGAWNKLCQIDGQSIKNIKTLCDFVGKEPQTRVIIVSATNELNARYCHETISKKIEKFNALVENRKIICVFSFEKKTTSLQKLAELGIKEATVELEVENKPVNYDVTSFHKNITFKGNKNIPFNPGTNTMVDALNKLIE